MMIALNQDDRLYYEFTKTYCQKDYAKKPRPQIRNAETVELHWEKLLKHYYRVSAKRIARYLWKRFGGKKNYKKSYLTTLWWYVIRHKRLAMDGFRCTRCGSREDLQVHHRNYEFFGREIQNMDSIETLCYRCHMVEEHGQEIDLRKRNVVTLTEEDQLQSYRDAEMRVNRIHEHVEMINAGKQLTVVWQEVDIQEIQNAVLLDFEKMLAALREP